MVEATDMHICMHTQVQLELLPGLLSASMRATLSCMATASTTHLATPCSAKSSLREASSMLRGPDILGSMTRAFRPGHCIHRKSKRKSNASFQGYRTSQALKLLSNALKWAAQES